MRDAEDDMIRPLDVATSLAASVARLGSGLTVGALGARPKKRLELYEYEGCPYCRKVREALTMLDLEAIIYPCPKGGTRFRSAVRELGGKPQFPFFVDPNTDTAMYESDDIVRYLYKTYGDGNIPLALRLGPITTISSTLASAARPVHGIRALPSLAPAKPLELWSFEASPFCRLARETLSSLEIPYVLHNVGKKSPSRKKFTSRSGKMMVPFLADPNTGKEMFESADIVAYLHETYGKN